MNSPMKYVEFIQQAIDNKRILEVDILGWDQSMICLPLTLDLEKGMMLVRLTHNMNEAWVLFSAVQVVSQRKETEDELHTQYVTKEKEFKKVIEKLKDTVEQQTGKFNMKDWYSPSNSKKDWN